MLSHFHHFAAMPESASLSGPRTVLKSRSSVSAGLLLRPVSALIFCTASETHLSLPPVRFMLTTPRKCCPNHDELSPFKRSPHWHDLPCTVSQTCSGTVRRTSTTLCFLSCRDFPGSQGPCDQTHGHGSGQSGPSDRMERLVQTHRHAGPGVRL